MKRVMLLLGALVLSATLALSACSGHGTSTPCGVYMPNMQMCSTVAPLPSPVVPGTGR
jgi:hypothetical protein